MVLFNEKYFHLCMECNAVLSSIISKFFPILAPARVFNVTYAWLKDARSGHARAPCAETNYATLC